MTKGTLIVGYGTRTGKLTTIIETQAKRLRARGRKNVYTAYFRVSSPTIPDALAQMAADGVDDVLVLPYYVAEGTLTAELIPKKLGISGRTGAADVNGKKVLIREAYALGNTWVTTDILCDRIAEADGDMEKSGILVIGHGSKDPISGNCEVIRTNALRLQKIGYKHVVYAFNEFVEPDIDKGVEELVSQGCTDIVVVPAFISDGVHLCEEIAEKLKIPNYSAGGEAEFLGKKVSIKYMRPLEDDPRILELLDCQIEEFYGE